MRSHCPPYHPPPGGPASVCGYGQSSPPRWPLHARSPQSGPSPPTAMGESARDSPLQHPGLPWPWALPERHVAPAAATRSTHCEPRDPLSVPSGRDAARDIPLCAGTGACSARAGGPKAVPSPPVVARWWAPCLHEVSARCESRASGVGWAASRHACEHTACTWAHSMYIQQALPVGW